MVVGEELKIKSISVKECWTKKKIGKIRSLLETAWIWKNIFWKNWKIGMGKDWTKKRDSHQLIKK